MTPQQSEGAPQGSQRGRQPRCDQSSMAAPARALGPSGASHRSKKRDQMMRERTKAGLEHARARGVKLGRRPKLTQMQRAEVIEMVRSERKTAAEAARIFNVHPSTI